MAIYFSTSCINQELLSVLDIYSSLGIKNVELGVYDRYIDNLKATLEKHDFNYIVHHYFPPPKESFIVNIASSNEKILNRSITQIINSIDFCNEFNINYLSIHSGFRVDPTSDFKFNLKKVPRYEKSFNIFVDSIKEILNYAETNDVEIAIENNVVSKHNLINGENRLLLMCESWEFEQLFNEIQSKNLSVLLDMGHLKVNANTLKFDMETFVDEIKKYVSAVHIHENNGQIDEHKCIGRYDQTLRIFHEHFKTIDIPSVLECKFKNKKEIEKAFYYLNCPKLDFF